MTRVAARLTTARSYPEWSASSPPWRWWMLLPVVPSLAFLMSVVGLFFALFFESPGSTVSAAYVPEATGLAAVLAVLGFGLGVVALGGWIALLVFLCLDTNPGSNKYGPSPKNTAPPTGPGGFYPPAGYAQPYPQPSPYGYPAQSPVPPTSGHYPPQP